MITIANSLEGLALRLRPCSETPELDAAVLLSRLIKKPRAWLAAHTEERLEPGIAAAAEESVRRLEQGEPLPYVLGEWEFFSLPFEVNREVLIPRPETELLVEGAIAWLRNRLERQHQQKKKRTTDLLPAGGALNVLDVGTGCGCIAVALAFNVPEVQVWATDISSAALEIARRNADRYHLASRINFMQADLVPAEFPPPMFSLIVANLPYIPTSTLLGLPIFGREPTLALDGGADGLTLVRRLIQRSPQLLAQGGRMLLEIEASQGSAALSLAYDTFDQAEIHLHKDLAGKDRLLEVQL